MKNENENNYHDNERTQSLSVILVNKILEMKFSSSYHILSYTVKQHLKRSRKKD